MPSEYTRKTKKKEKIPSGKNLRQEKSLEAEDNLQIFIEGNLKVDKIRLILIISRKVNVSMVYAIEMHPKIEKERKNPAWKKFETEKKFRSGR